MGVMRDLAGRVENCLPRWFGHIECMVGERMAKRIYGSWVEGRRCRRRPNGVDGWCGIGFEGRPWSRRER